MMGMFIVRWVWLNLLFFCFSLLLLLLLLLFIRLLIPFRFLPSVFYLRFYWAFSLFLVSYIFRSFVQSLFDCTMAITLSFSVTIRGKGDRKMSIATTTTTMTMAIENVIESHRIKQKSQTKWNELLVRTSHIMRTMKLRKIFFKETHTHNTHSDSNNYTGSSINFMCAFIVGALALLVVMVQTQFIVWHREEHAHFVVYGLYKIPDPNPSIYPT